MNEIYEINKNLGHVTAYAYAVEKGYTGTEEEFAELMASYATVAESAAESAEDALESATQSGQYANTSRQYSEQAGDSASSASTSATSAGTSKSDSEAYAVGKRNGADVTSGDVAYHNNAKYYAEQASSSESTASSAKDTAVSAKDTAVSKASEASTSAQTATTKASQASASEANASAYKLVSEGYAVGKQDGADVSSDSPYYENNAKYYAEKAEETLGSYARVDGAYESMTVGNAEQLVSTLSETDQVPYHFRTAGGSMDIGDREVDTIVGGSLPWNQLVEELNSTNWYGQSASVSFADGVATFTATAQYGQLKQNSAHATPMINGHKYLVLSKLTLTNSASMGIYYHNGLYVASETFPSGVSNVAKVIVSNATDDLRLQFQDNSASNWSPIKVENVQTFDLTLALGTQIADYIYSLEQANAGSGVAWFKRYFPKSYYPYVANSLESVSGLQSHDMVGFNQWDEEWELGQFDNATGQPISASDCIRSKYFIPCLPNTAYFTNKGVGGIQQMFYYDADKNFISQVWLTGTFTTPSNAHYMKFRMASSYGTTYNNDICINLHWDGERDGEYEQYKLNSYPLDSSLTLRGIPKLDANNSLYYDGDTYESDGTVTRRYGIVDLGTLNWSDTGSGDSMYFYAVISDKRILDVTDVPCNIVCDKLSVVPIVGSSSLLTNKSIMEGRNVNPIVLAKDLSCTTVAEFKTSVSGAYLVYELATPTTETAEPYQNPQIVDNWGTEEYVTTSIVPVGHRTEYQPNLRAKIEVAPESPDGDGDYIMRQTSGANSYVALASTNTIQSIISRLEALENA